ncbi:unnamed protein product [Spirodela intermedia]|uniref:Hpc2-related domain-containing protein n=1 Tax=Spirodela intermedia TaxID=51605 RepID=A0A7I8JC58_SPIIN|nr:unnamed protein product [Spirodela intermedia]CAA6667709.1 unnamed protein product [Spirodela intermedia]
MDEEKGGGSISGRVSSSFPSSAAPPIHRRRFTVELRYGQTTIVSWKRLVRETNKSNGEPAAPSGAHPALESRIAPPAAAFASLSRIVHRRLLIVPVEANEKNYQSLAPWLMGIVGHALMSLTGPRRQLCLEESDNIREAHPMEGEQKDAQPAPNRFSAVIEKIERLYMGKESSDEEEVDDVPDDDQYDTEDSFIDDSELNEYFEVEKQATKHNGFFVNRGPLERIEPSSSVPSLVPKKRRRKDSTKGEDTMNELVNVGSVRLKAAARNAPLNYGLLAEHGHEGKIIKNKLSTSVGMYRKKNIDPTIKVDSLPYVKLQSESFSAVNLLPSREKGSYFQVEPHSRLIKENEIEVSPKIRRMEKNGSEMLPDLNSPGDMYSLQRVKSSFVKEGSGIVRPKGTTLERAIRDLEKIVSACRPPNMDIQDFDASSQVKKRLPQEVKQKLAKVARLAASQGKVKEEDLVDRLMGIVGHLVQRKTLKRNLKEMVELGLSAKQIKDDRFQQIKKEVTEMIKTRIVHSRTKVPEQQDSFSDDFQEVVGNEEKRVPKAKYSMDDAIEDKICDLYELYVEDKGPQMRKLYVEVMKYPLNSYIMSMAERLHGQCGIKDAIYRARERKKAFYRQQNDDRFLLVAPGREEERMKRKKLSAAGRLEENAVVTLGLQAQQLPSLYLPEANEQVAMAAHQPPSLTQPGRMADQAPSFPNGGPVTTTSSRRIPRGAMRIDAAALLKRKLKRKLNPETGEAAAVAPVREKLGASGPSLDP